MHIKTILLLLALGGCASVVTVDVKPAPQAPVCQPRSNAHVLWITQWRADQKDVPAREAAADEGIRKFFGTSGCFAAADIERRAEISQSEIEARAAQNSVAVIVLTVRELGPILRIGSSAALVEGGTEVVLEVAEYHAGRTEPRRFSVVWRDGGPGTIKGVATLPKDMQSALAAGLQSSPR
jgi:hypothetical protein